jgi:hypothetical protein
MLKGKHGFQMMSHEILEIFGLKPHSPIPVDFEGSRVIDGVEVIIRAKRARDWEIKRRVVARCPYCSTLVCAGHLHQHFKVHRKEMN